MTTKQMMVSEGNCPRCGTANRKLAEFINDPCVNPLGHVEYFSCKRCKKVWEWTTDSLGTEIVDLKLRIKQLEQDVGSAS
jgi:hypothetical protein